MERSFGVSFLVLFNIITQNFVIRNFLKAYLWQDFLRVLRKCLVVVSFTTNLVLTLQVILCCLPNMLSQS